MILRDYQRDAIRALADKAPGIVRFTEKMRAFDIDHAVGHAPHSRQLYAQQHGRAYRPVRLSTTAPEVRGDVRDAVLDAYMIQRVEAMGASQLDIDDAFGGSRLGFSEPVIT